MKSKSPSVASKRSTPKGDPRSGWFGRSADALPIHRKRQSAALLLASILAASCSSVPESSQPEATAPNAITQVPAERGVTHSISIQTPTPAWSIVPLILYRTGENDYLCIYMLAAPEGMVAQMLSSAATQISFQHQGDGEPAIQHYILGKTWNWNGNPEYKFIDSLEDIKDALADAQSVPFTTP